MFAAYNDFVFLLYGSFATWRMRKLIKGLATICGHKRMIEHMLNRLDGAGACWAVAFLLHLLLFSQSIKRSDGDRSAK